MSGLHDGSIFMLHCKNVAGITESVSNFSVALIVLFRSHSTLAWAQESGSAQMSKILVKTERTVLVC